jgi:DNA-binding MarR family transcriptional regulator
MSELVLDDERRREVSQSLGLSFSKIRALRRIARKPMTMGEVATAAGIDAPGATLLVDELEQLGLVERRSHPTDRRVRMVMTTSRGARAARSADDILGRPPASLAGLSDRELATLVKILEKVSSHPGT